MADDSRQARLNAAAALLNHLAAGHVEPGSEKAVATCIVRHLTRAGLL
jgi:hypothetical protein